MVEDLIKRLLEAGVHFGHQTKRWNPKMKKFIFGQRSGIYIIDLEKTVECLNAASEAIKDIASKGGKVLFVGTKKQAQMIVEAQGKRADMSFVRNRWPGGLLTNFQTVKNSLGRLSEIEKMEIDGTWENLKKKETARLSKEKEKLLINFGGIREMKKMPELVVIVDPKREEIAVKEAKKLNIPIIAIIDTNCDPDLIDYPIPGNDDALKSVNILLTILCDNILEGKREFAMSSNFAEKGDDKSAAKKEASVA